MRHARKAAARATLAMLLSATFAFSPEEDAHAILASGGASAPVAAVATRGTGGTVYVAARSKARPARKPVHKARHPRLAPKPKPRARTPQPGTPVSIPTTPAVSEAGVPSPAQTAGEAAVFPVLGPHSFGNAENRFGAVRTGHIHEGQDVLAGEGQTVVAPLAGTIITTAYQAGGAGWYAAEHTVDGLDFFFAHCKASSLAVSTGQAVAAGQAICNVGQTGDATGPHLHFEIWVGGWQAAGGHAIDPLPYLEAWDHTPGG
ncbi:MAG TPA: peptidoglycan DD-metalloendopeptidase family protein [Solirubrobacteraceae bacterium]|jgi:murein DD-endopeptidase MepM/ murein hydrolase activator NlpD|nr:peptidoglycan DD-metalloendopeptidase family protein [Solirubrobacteraceae bacterium]